MFQLILFALLFGLFVYRRIERMSILERSGIPGPKPNLITGNYFDFFSKPNVVKLSEYYEKYGKVFGYYLGRQMVVNVVDLNLIQEIQIKSFSQFSKKEIPELRYGVYPDPEMHRNILTVNGNAWKATRAILSSAFNGAKLKTMTPVINSSVEVLMDKVEERVKLGGEFNIYDHLKPMAMDVMAKVVLDVDSKFQDNPVKSAKPMNDKLMASFLWFSEFDCILYYVRRSIQVITELLPKYFNVYSYRNGGYGGGFSSYGGGRAAEKLISNEMDQQSKLPVSDLMKSMIDSQQTPGEAVSNGTYLYRTGSSITSSAVSFVFHFLVNRPDIQGKVRQEITEHLTDGKFDHESMSKLDYLQAVIYETLRCLPPLTTFTTRSSETDFHYKDIVLPKKSLIRVPLHQLHHTEEYWPKHDQFNPDRFLDKSNLNSIAFQPFGAGPRICLGARFAMLEMKLILAQLLSKYEFVPGPNTEKELIMNYGSFYQTPANGVWLKAVPLN